jgi:hypothetical protein
MRRAREVLHEQSLEWEESFEDAVRDVALAIDAAVAEEREACAYIADDATRQTVRIYAASEVRGVAMSVSNAIAEAIRKRSPRSPSTGQEKAA